MRVENNCIKDVIKYVIDNAIVEYNDLNVGYKGISLLSIINEMSKSGKYKKEQILHSCIYAYKCQYIDTNRDFKDGTDIMTSKAIIYDVTPYGYKFLEEDK